MKTMKLIIPVAAILLLAGQAAAQTDEQRRAEAEKEAAAALQEAELREAEVARKLADAERQMAEAARQIAELTAERLPQLREVERRIELISDKRPRLGINIGDERSNGPVEGVRTPPSPRGRAHGSRTATGWPRSSRRPRPRTTRVRRPRPWEQSRSPLPGRRGARSSWRQRADRGRTRS